MKMKEVFDCCVRDDSTKDAMLYKLHRLEELIVWGRLIGNSLTLNLLSLCRKFQGAALVSLVDVTDYNG